jgi:hypothetical protein
MLLGVGERSGYPRQTNFSMETSHMGAVGEPINAHKIRVYSTVENFLPDPTLSFSDTSHI